MSYRARTAPVRQIGLVEAERARDGHGVVDVDRVGGGGAVQGEVGEQGLLPGGGEAVEAGRADEAQELEKIQFCLWEMRGRRF